MTKSKKLLNQIDEIKKEESLMHHVIQGSVAIADQIAREKEEKERKEREREEEPRRKFGVYDDEEEEELEMEEEECPPKWKQEHPDYRDDYYTLEDDEDDPRIKHCVMVFNPEKHEGEKWKATSPKKYKVPKD